MSEMIDKFYKAIDDIKNMFTAAQAMAENSFKVSEENTRLREALEKYGRHLGDCSGSFEYEGFEKGCHCGYEQALKE